MKLVLNIKTLLLCFIWFFMLVITFFSDFLPMVYGGYADQRFILCLSLILIISITLPSAVLSKKKMVIILPFLLCLIIGGFMSNVNPYNWIEPLLYCFFFISICLIGNYITVNNLQSKACFYLVWLAAVVCFFYASVSLMLYVFSLEKNLSSFSNVIPFGFDNIRFWSHTATWLLPLFPLAVIGYDQARYRLWRFMVMFTAAIWWWLAIHMVSRGSILSLVIATIVVLIIFQKLALPWFKLMCHYFIVGTLTWFLLSYVVPEWILNIDETLIRSLNTTSSGRIPLWEEAWAMSLQNFPFGMGAQSWLTHDLLIGSYKDSIKLSHPHNMYLMWAAEYGWISVLCILSVVCWVFFRLREKSRAFIHNKDLDSQNVVGFTAAVIAGFIHAGVSAVFIIPGSMMLGLGVLAEFLALILPVSGYDKGSEGSQNQRIKRPLFMLMFLALSVWWLTQVWNYHEAMLKDLVTDEGKAAQELKPRFWLQGNYPRTDTHIN